MEGVNPSPPPPYYPPEYSSSQHPNTGLGSSTQFPRNIVVTVEPKRNNPAIGAVIFIIFAIITIIIIIAVVNNYSETRVIYA